MLMINVSPAMHAVLTVVTEAREKGGKNHFIEGVFMQSEQRNRNGRVYPKPVMEKAVDKYVTEQVKTGRAVGELNHPEGSSVPTTHLTTNFNVYHKVIVFVCL